MKSREHRSISKQMTSSSFIQTDANSNSKSKIKQLNKKIKRVAVVNRRLKNFFEL